MERLEPDYPEGVTPSPSRYKTGYGQEGYIITPSWSTITAYDRHYSYIRMEAKRRAVDSLVRGTGKAQKMGFSVEAPEKNPLKLAVLTDQNYL